MTPRLPVYIEPGPLRELPNAPACEKTEAAPLFTLPLMARASDADSFGLGGVASLSPAAGAGAATGAVMGPALPSVLRNAGCVPGNAGAGLPLRAVVTGAIC